MNPEDVSIVRAERDASPQRFADFDPQDSFGRHYGPQRRGSEAQDPTRGGSQGRSGPRIDGSESGSTTTRESVEIEPLRGTGSVLSREQTRTEKINGPLERHPTALERIETHRSQHSNTVGPSITNVRSRKAKPLPNFGAGKPFPPLLPEREEYVVEFDGHDDPLHPHNWTTKQKLFIALVLAFDSLAATFASSVFSAATAVVATEYGVSREVGVLTTSLYVLGYAFGPIIWAPFSELYGRRIPILVSSFGFSIFCIGVAVAKDLQTVMLCRFFGGLFGSAPLAIVAAVFSDMFNNAQRGVSIAVFSATVFMGPFLGPFIGGFIVISYLGWRWTMYITAIMGFTSFTLALFFQKESYPPVILVGKASELRRRTKNWGIHAKQEEVEVDPRELITKNVSRPLRILFTEPIVLLVSLYMAFLYGLLYLFLTAYALVFQGVYGFNPGVGGLPYFGMIIGVVIGFCAIVSQQGAYVKKLAANDNVPVPEWRLPLVIVGGSSFAAGLFWFGWSGHTRSVHWIVPTLSGLCTGFGIYTVFLQLLNYIVDAYLMFAASAIAGNTFLRSLFGCIFPLFATYMFNGMGIQWAATLLGCVALVLVPMPIIFLLKGSTIRRKSKMAPGIDLKLADKRRAMAQGDVEKGEDVSGERDDEARIAEARKREKVG